MKPLSNQQPSGASGRTCLPVSRRGYLRAVGLGRVSVTGLDLDAAIQQEGTEVAVDLRAGRLEAD